MALMSMVDSFNASIRRAKEILERLTDGRAYSQSHGKFFTKRLHHMFLSKEYCDVTLETCTSSTKAHKLVLVANSDYFSTMFSTTCLESCNNVVSFKDNPYITSFGLAAILEYAYTGSFPVTEDGVCDILETARYFLMDDVTNTCSKFIAVIKVKEENCVWLSNTVANYGLYDVRPLIENYLINQKVTMDNYLVVLDSAITINSDMLLEGVVPFFISNLPYLLCSNELLEVMDSKILRSIIKSDKHGLFNDLTLIDFIVKWVERSEEDRSPVLHELFRSVNLLSFDEESLESISKLLCIQKDERCMVCIRRAQLDIVDLKKYSQRRDDRYLVSMQDNDVYFVDISDSSRVIIKGYSEIPGERGRASLLPIVDKLFLIYDADNNDMCPCYIYEPSRNIWKRLASLTGKRDKLCLINLGSYVYAIGGQEKYKPTERVDVYDLSRNEWFTGIPLHRSFFSVLSVVFYDRIFVLGQVRIGDVVEFFQYDPNGMLSGAQRQCSQPASKDQINYKCVLVPGGECIYRFFINRNKTLNIDRYDPALNRWSSSTACIMLAPGYEDLKLGTGIAHKGEILLVFDYLKKDGNSSHNRRNSNALFRYNEATNSIELPVEDIAIGNHLAMVHIPKMSLDRLYATNLHY